MSHNDGIELIEGVKGLFIVTSRVLVTGQLAKTGLTEILYIKVAEGIVVASSCGEILVVGKVGAHINDPPGGATQLYE